MLHLKKRIRTLLQFPSCTSGLPSGVLFVSPSVVVDSAKTSPSSFCRIMRNHDHRQLATECDRSLKAFFTIYANT